MIDLVDVPRFDFGSAEYRAFFARCGVTPFQHPDWLAPFYQRLPQAAGQSPLILVGRRAGDLCCVIPLLRDTTGPAPRITFAFLEVTDYACPVIDPDALGEIDLAANLARLVGSHSLDISPIHSDDRTLWSALLAREPVPLPFGAHAVVLPPGLEPLRGDHAGHLRGLARKARRLAEMGDVRLEQVRGDRARIAIEAARAFRIGRFPRDPLEVDPSAAFYADVAASAAGLPRTYRLMCGQHLVAVMFGLVHRRRFHYLILACDYAAFARYSPGLLIMDQAIASWAAEGGTVFDFTIGDEPFKARFGCARTPMYAIRAGSEQPTADAPGAGTTLAASG